MSKNLQAAHDSAMKKKNRDKGGGTGKYGRNKMKCAAYRLRQKGELQTGNKKPKGGGRPWHSLTPAEKRSRVGCAVDLNGNRASLPMPTRGL